MKVEGIGMRGIATFLLCAAVLPALAQTRSLAQARSRIDVPVMIGGGPDLPACPGGGTITGLDPNGDGFLSVMSGPGGAPFHETDRIYNGQAVALCDTRGRWFGIVYSTGGRDQDCGIDGSVLSRIPYTGPCRFGWAYGGYIGDRRGG